MKTVQKENRVEHINDTDLADALRRGWREIDPVTGDPVVGESLTLSVAALTAANAKIAALEGENVRLKDALAAKEVPAEPHKGKPKGKAADKRENTDAAEAANEPTGDAAE